VHPARTQEENLEMCSCGSEDPSDHDPFIDSKVEWMHESVIEFLSNASLWQSDSLRVDKDRPGRSAALSLYSMH
jgi:hypothetical protein